MDTIKIEPKLIDINTETYWGMIDRLYAQCERAMVSKLHNYKIPNGIIITG